MKVYKNMTQLVGRTPLMELGKYAKDVDANIIGCALFLLLNYVLPANIFAYVGIIGGIGVGFSAKYKWQTVFNTFGALYIAASLYGIPAAIFLRIFHNAIASVFTVISDKIFNIVTNNILDTQYQE